MIHLTEAERAALECAARTPLVTTIPDRTERDALGEVVPGRRVFRKLERLGLLFETIEDPIDLDGTPFFSTPSIELTTEGARFLAALHGDTPDAGVPPDGV